MENSWVNLKHLFVEFLNKISGQYNAQRKLKKKKSCQENCLNT